MNPRRCIPQLTPDLGGKRNVYSIVSLFTFSYQSSQSIEASVLCPTTSKTPMLNWKFNPFTGIMHKSSEKPFISAHAKVVF